MAKVCRQRLSTTTGSCPARGSGSRCALLPPRRGISLMEVLISMFILLFGLMGVAAIFPVGNHYVVQGEKFDRGNTLALNAFEEIRARGMLRPEAWLYAGNSVDGTQNSGDEQVIDPNTGLFNIRIPPFMASNVPGPGHAFVIDPMSSASAISLIDLDVWPQFNDLGVQDASNPWYMNSVPGVGTPIRQTDGNRWPVRRITLPLPDPTGTLPFVQMSSPVAETIFRLRDDLAVELPERDDFPGILRWSSDGTQLLARQYQGNFSWLATVVPLTVEGRNALQPNVRNNHPYEVSVVVFYKRVETPGPETERQLNAEILPGGELVMHGPAGGVASDVDAKFEDIKSGDWVCVMGVNETTGVFLLKWYRLLALDEEAFSDGIPSAPSGNYPQRRAMLLGPDWPIRESTNFAGNLRVAIFPGVASAVTREMVLETGSLWD